MKFFTIQTWSEYSEETIRTDREYKSYIAAIRNSLPQDAQRLYSGGGLFILNDANLLNLSADFQTGKVSMTLKGDFKDGALSDDSMSTWPIVAYRISLNYTGVTSFSTKSDPLVGLAGPFGYGDIGFDELEQIADNCFEHRILFSSGIELQVRFAEMKIEREPMESYVS
jgi:hypothetical protein